MHKHEPVNRLMTEAVLSIGVDEPAGEVLRLFREYPVHHLPVVEDRRVIGMLSGSDLLKLRALIPKSVASPEKYLSEKLKVRSLISKPAITIGSHDTVERASELMAQHGIHSLPVVNSAGHLVGILTTTDIMSAMFAAAPPRADVRASADAPGARMTREQFLRTAALAMQVLGEGRDEDGLAAALVYAQHRIALLEDVAAQAARYLGAGQDVELHRALGKAIDHARAAEVSESGGARTFGLGAA
jgi:CBS domain-containing protein